jgi:tetratricopeptide (TPR) repeat protein
MLKKPFLIALSAVLILAALAVPARAQQITDAKEYNAYVTALGEKDPAKQIQMLDAYLIAYPKTVMKEQALELKLRAQQTSGQMGAETARAILQVNPNNTTAMLVLSYAFMQTPLSEADPSFQQKLSDTEANAKHGIETVNAMAKPANASDDAFQASKNTMLATHYQSLAIVGLYRKDYAASLDAFKQAAKITPNDGALFYRIGDTLAKERPVKWDQALWAFARAVSLEGPGALPPANKQPVDDYLTKVYNTYHGSGEGLAELKEQAKAAAFAPDGFHIKTKAEMAPPPPPPPPEAPIPADVTKMPFGQIVMVLSKDDDKAKEVLGKLKAVGGMDLEGVIVSATPAAAPKTIHIAVLKKTQDTPGAFDVELLLAAPTTAVRAAKGKTIEFEGTVKSYTASPFSLTLSGGKILPPPRR